MQNDRVLGIDYGTVRVGLSLSDPLGITAQPFETIPNNPLFWKRLKALIDERHVAFIVVGMPLNLKGQQGEMARQVAKFIEQLKKETQKEVLTWDERFTSSIAEQTFLEMGTKKSQRRKNKGQIDSMAAAVMLQSFLDSTKRSMSC